MVVRFLPERSPAQPDKDFARDNLAEVIDIRARILEPREDTVTGPKARQTESVEDESVVEKAQVKEVAIKMLARKAMSSGELKNKLTVEGYESGEIEEVLQSFSESLYLDDLGLARVLSDKLQRVKQASKSQIALKLREKLLPVDVIDEVLAEISAEEDQYNLQLTAQKRARSLRGLERSVAERRLVGYLTRRGWSVSESFKAAKEALDFTVQG